MRSQEEIQTALNKLRYKNSRHQSKKLRIMLHELSFYQKNPQIIDDFVYTGNIYTDWLQGKRNSISKLLKRIKI